MPIPDLPVELWLHIVSYLPPFTARKLMGISRSLFELALDDLYRQIDIIFDDDKSRYRVSQIQRPDICNRVRHVQINPRFLPSVIAAPAQNSSHLGSLKGYIQRAFTVQPFAPSTGILQLSRNNIGRCSNLQHLTLALRDCELTPDLVSLLSSVYDRISVNPQLKKLVIDAETIVLQELLLPLTRKPQCLSRLQELDITILPTSPYRFCEKEMLAFHSLKALLWTSKNTLRSFAFSSSVEINLDQHLAAFPYLPHLRSLSLCVAVHYKSFPTTNGIFGLIQEYAPQLEHFELLPTPSHQDRYHRAFHSDLRYESLFAKQGPQDSQNTISQLTFPNLTSFCIGIPSYRYHFVNVTERVENPLPPLASMMPNLTSLVLNDGFKLSPDALKEFLDGLPLQNGIIALIKLELSCHTLDPQLLDNLALRLPKLRILTINYVVLSVGSEGTVDLNWVPFCMAMKSRRYLDWYVEELRLARPAPGKKDLGRECLAPHPALPAMAALADSLALGRKNVYLDRALYCKCTPD